MYDTIWVFLSHLPDTIPRLLPLLANREVFPLTNLGVEVESWVSGMTLTSKQAMKRDMELVRKILLYAVEQYILPTDAPVNLIGYGSKNIHLYIQMLIEAGFIVGNSNLPSGSIGHVNPDPPGHTWEIDYITWKGYELLESL